MNDASARADGDDPRAEPARATTIEAYETEDGIVLYDPENLLAWVEATRAFALGDVV